MKKTLLLLAEGFEILEASAFIDVMGWNLIEGDKTTKLFSCGIKKKFKVHLIKTLLLIIPLIKLM